MQPVQMGSSAGTGEAAARRAASMGIIAAVLYALGIFLPYLSGGGIDASLTEGDASEVYVMFLLPAAVAVVAGFRGLQGSAIAGGLAAGAATGMFGVTVFLMAVVHLFTGYGVSVGVAFWMHGAAAAVSLVATVSALAAAKSMADSSGLLSQGLCVLGALSFFGMTAAILLPEDGYSVFDIEEGWVKAGALAWAIVSPLAGAIAAFSRSRLRVGYAFGVSLGHLGVVLALAMQNDASGEGLTSGFNVSNEGLFNVTVIASVLLTGAALATAPKGAMAGAAAGAYGGTSYGSAGGGAAQWATDPFGRHQMRYYNGVEWTASVSDNGVVATDPPVHAPAAPAAYTPATPAYAPVAPVAPVAPPMPEPGPAGGPFASPAPTSSRVCSNGHVNAPTSAFCTQCGAPL